MKIIYVALGGAIGAVLRYMISLIPVKSDFPILTLATNFIGAIAIGIVVELLDEKENLPSWISPFFKTGVCGGFTTFSTFSLEASLLFQGQRYFLFILYSLLSFVLCLIGIFVGRFVVKGLIK